MGILDRFTNGFLRTFDLLLGPFDEIMRAVANRDPDTEEGTEQVAQIIAQSTQLDEGSAALVDAFEEFVLSDLEAAGELTPENVEAVTDQTEGNAIALLGSIIGGSMALEVGSAGQVDESQQHIVEALAGLGVDDVTGFELQWRMEKGVGPAMEAKVAKEHRSEYVNLGDAVEYALRTKDKDQGWLHRSGASEEALERVDSKVTVSEDNILEEWGIRDDNLPILEEVGLTVPEFEELIETPTEFGVLIDPEVVESVLDRSGYPEDLKAEFLKVADNVTQATTVYEERTAYEELVAQLDEVMADEELTPDEARPLLAGLDDRIVDELVERWTLIQEVPNTGPTRSLIEGSFAAGYTDLDTLADRLDRLEYDTERYDDILRTTVRDDIDGDLQQAFAFGQLTAGEYGELMDFVGLPDEAQQTLTAGGSLSDATERILTEQTDPVDQPVESIGGIGDTRGSGLRAVGINTVGDLADADPDLVSEAAQVDLEQAQAYIDAAILRT